MKFGRIPLAQAENALLAHSMKVGAVRLKKGRRLDAEDIRALAAAGIDTIVGARLEAGEIGEDEAAARVVEAIRGDNLSADAPSTGRCNLYTAARGLLVYERDRLDELNLVDEAVTIGVIAPYSVVEPEQMIATVKIIPYGVAASSVDAVAGSARRYAPLLRVNLFQPRRIGLVQTRVDGTRETVLDKTRRITEQRLGRLGSRLVFERRCAHHEEEVESALAEVAGEGCDLVLIAGASATADRRDVVPVGIERAGGSVVQIGMPVVPGNLLLLARLADGRPVVCMPGSARSPARNGFDWVLERILAGLLVGREDIMRMGAGGLIKGS